MVESTALRCGPLRPAYSNQKTPAFGSERREDAQASNKPQKGAIRSAVEPVKDMSLKKAGKQFWNGVVSPVEAVISNPMAAGVTLGGFFAIRPLAKKFPKIAKFSIATSAGIAVYNFGKGLLDFATAKTAKEKEESFYDMGQGTVYGALAVLPAKNVAKADKISGITDKSTSVQSFWACLRTIPDDAKNISKAIGSIIKSGDLKPLQTALGPYSGAAVLGTEALNGSAAGDGMIDPPDIPVGNGDSDGSLASDLKEAVKSKDAEAIKKAVEIAQNEPTAGVAVKASQAEKEKDEDK